MTTLIKILADGQYHSGQSIGLLLGLGRSAIWKQVHSLRARGWRVDAIKGRGYRLVGGLDFLDKSGIVASLNTEAKASLSRVDVFEIVDSTNEVALSYARSEIAAQIPGYACFAEAQTAGKGRRGRVWVSPPARNIYLSLVWKFSGGFGAIQGLSLAAGIAVCEALEAVGCNGIWLKWPNDIYHGDAKVGGILIEVVGEVGGECTVVIGVGVNVAMSEGEGGGISRKWSSLVLIGLSVGRTELAGRLLNSLAGVLGDFDAHGLQYFQGRWDRLDGLRGKLVSVDVGGEVLEGKAAGIDHIGALLLDGPFGLRRLSAGEVTVRTWL